MNQPRMLDAAKGARIGTSVVRASTLSALLCDGCGKPTHSRCGRCNERTCGDCLTLHECELS